MTARARWKRGAQLAILAIVRRLGPLSHALVGGRLSQAGFLSRLGWQRSIFTMMAVDAQGEPLPWLTYGAIRFLESRLPAAGSELEIFEYGSGQSTLWWSRRAARVVSCEHDRAWYELFSSQVPGNVTYLYRPLDEGYCESLEAYPGRFDIVVIDGRRRVRCAGYALAALSGRGIVLWDNSERDSYAPGKTLLLDQGFREIEFFGLGPASFQTWSTSVFYRPGNLLGI